MTTKKSMIFLFAVILISVAFMTTLLFTDKKPNAPNGSAANAEQNDDLNQTGSDQAKKELKIAVSMPTSEYLKLVALSHQFEQLNQDIKIEVEAIDKADAYDFYKKSSQMGDAPDIMLLDNAWVNEFAVLGYLAQVDEILSSNIKELQVAPMISQVKWNGFLWAIPKEIDPYVLVWNKERFDEFGYNDIPKSLDGLLLLNQKLTDPDEGKLGFYIDYSDPYAFVSMLWMLGEMVMETDDEVSQLFNDVTMEKIHDLLYPTNLTRELVDTPVSVDEDIDPETSDISELGGTDESNGLNMEHLIKERQLEEDPSDAQILNDMLSMRETSTLLDDLEHLKVNDIWYSEDFNAWTALDEGTISFMLARLSEFKHYESERFSMAALPVTAMPESDAGTIRGGWLQGKSFAVSSKSDLKQEAFEWIQNVTTTDAQLDLMNAGGGFPVMISAYAERLNSATYYEEIVKAIRLGHTFPIQPQLNQKLKLLQGKAMEFGRNTITLPLFLEQLDEAWNNLSKH